MTLAQDWPRPATVLEHYRRSLEALDALAQVVSGGVGPHSRFFGMTPEEVDASLRGLRRELDQEVTLLLVASFEAAIQVDYHARIGGRKKDAVSRELRKLSYEIGRGGRPPRERRVRWMTVEDVLDVWRQETGRVQAVGNLKQLIQYRHWLAHGRYWVQQSGLREVDPFDAWERGRAVFDALPGFDPLPAA